MSKKPTPKAEPKAPETFDYTVNGDGFVAGLRRKKGETVKLTVTAAKYENVTRKGTETKAKADAK